MIYRLQNVRALTMDESRGESLGLIENAAVLFDDKKIHWVGPEKETPAQEGYSDIDGEGRLLSPGLIDCHSHLVFDGDRSDEFFARLRGDSYEAIAKRGGGIFKTREKTIEAKDETLLRALEKRLSLFLRFGVTTIEVKSGYGLSLEEELRGLRLISKYGGPVRVKPCLLGAHVIPREYSSKREKYVEIVIKEMLPQVRKEGLADVCDVFCDEGAFTIEETGRILSEAKKIGFEVKLHADQLQGTGAAELAVDLGALSADHLEQISEKGIEKLAKSQTVAVMIPGSVFFLGKRSYPPARKLLDRGAKLAISTDCNPGTSYSENLPLIMTFAAVELGMTVEEIWQGVTTNAAKAMGLSDRGQIKAGLRSDFCLWDADRPEEIPYHYGASFPNQVYISGKREL